MLKIQCQENNDFKRAKNFHKIKYYCEKKELLDKYINELNSKGMYESEQNILLSLRNELTNILIGDVSEINRIINRFHNDYLNVKNNYVITNNEFISMKELIKKIFDYEKFSEAKLYNDCIKSIIDLKSSIKKRERAGLTKGRYDINELRLSIIKTISNLSVSYNETKFEITSLVNHWEERVSTFDIPDVNNISELDLSLFEEMKLDLIYKRNDFWGSYNDLKDKMSNEEIKLSWGGYCYVNEIGIMTCPYCNRSYTNIIIGTKKSYRPALDHFYSKSEYPYLALSLFNLIPSCNICNSSFKSDDNIQITNLYENGFEDDYIFTYEVIDDSRPIDSENILIKIKPYGRNSILSENSIRLFELEAAYSTHKDIITRMYKLRTKYNDGEIIRMVKEGIFTSPANFVEQIILNGRADKERFHEMPLAKFKRDIAFQLGFLKHL